MVVVLNWASRDEDLARLGPAVMGIVRTELERVLNRVPKGTVGKRGTVEVQVGE